jgi:DNA-binding transcriptional LysR family regulator
MPVGLPPHALLPIFELCRERYPLLILDVEFHEDPTTAEEADVRFHFGDRLAKGPWITRTLMVVQEKLLASPRYLDARGVPKSLADLAQHDLLMWRRPTFAPDRLPTRDGGVFNVVPVLRTADIHHIRQLALRGAGIAFVPDAGLIDPEADPHGLVQVLPDLVQRPCGLHVLVPELLGRSPQVRALQESILAFLA